MAATLCELGVAVVLNLAVLERAAAAARLCVLEAWVVAAGLKLGGFEWTAAKQCLVGFQLVAVVVQAEAVLEVEAGGVAQSEAGVALPRRRPHRKTGHHRLSRVRAAEGCGRWSHAGLDGCGASVAAVRLAHVWAKAGAWVHLGGRLGSGGRIACTRQRRRGRRGNGPTCLLSVGRAPGRLLASFVAQFRLRRLHLHVSTGKR